MIGLVVNCPKCNSMLQVTEPIASEPHEAQTQVNGTQQPTDGRKIRVESHRGVIDSSAMTKDAFAPELEDEYRLAPAPQPALHSTKLVAPPQVDEEPIFGDPLDAPPLPAPKVSKGQPTVTSAQAGLDTSESNHIQLLAVRRTARRRQVLMVAVLGSSGVLLAGVLFTGFLYWYTGKSSPSIAKSSVNQGASQSSDEPKHVGPKLEPGQSDLQDSSADPPIDPPIDPPNTPTEDNSTTPDPTETDAEPNSVTNSITDAISNAIGSAEGTQPNLPNTSDQPNEAISPNKTDADASDQAPPSDVVRAEQSTTELPDQLKKFQSVLNKTIEPQFLEDLPIQKAPPTAKELGLSTGQDSKALPPVDITAQLELPITGLIIPAGTISNTISQWVQVSGIPTVVDLDSLVAAGIDRHESIGKILVSGESPLAQVAAAIAKEIGVDAKPVENFFAFQASAETIRARLPTSIKINDLVDHDKQEWLVKTLEQIWPEYEGKWTVADGELTVDPVVVDAQAWFWAVRMLETWRLAKGIETQLDKSKFSATKFVTKFIDPEQLPALNTPLGLTLANRAPVAQLISDVASAGKMHAWVDWASVSHKGLGPNTIDFLVTKQRTLRECFRDLAEKYSLVVACEDDKSLVITTAEIYRAQPRLFVLPSQGKTAEQWMDELQPLTPATAAAAQPIQAYLTPDSEFVIVRCCRPRLRN
jgi:hypothetical protein